MTSLMMITWTERLITMNCYKLFKTSYRLKEIKRQLSFVSASIPVSTKLIEEQLQNIGITKLDFISDNNNNRIVVYTDGCCLNNNQRDHSRRSSAIGVYWGTPQHPLNLGWKLLDEKQSSNRAEIIAVHTCIKIARHFNLKELLVYTDSTYVVNACNAWLMRWVMTKWRKPDGLIVKNIDLWKPFLRDFLSMDVIIQKCESKNDNLRSAHNLANIAAKHPIV
ncbi:unnamed protein product [Clavelina lepadiformis]|uniref:ribonuclease H n=1 Tax=Clavelina lepadiformis TaxID=159417 RepID=A0ABP0F908_CLALP